jgi:hypothetical protein
MQVNFIEWTLFQWYYLLAHVHPHVLVIVHCQS